jgi:hypothetical protein
LTRARSGSIHSPATPRSSRTILPVCPRATEARPFWMRWATP